MFKGIDVSHHQGIVDWPKVRADGVQFAMLRAGFGWDNDSQIDKQFYRNANEAQAAGVPCGLYHYSYARTPSDARKEAAFFLRIIKSIKPEYPVAFDFEEQAQVSLPPSQQLDIIEAFLETVGQARYYVALYMSASTMQQLYQFAPERIKKVDCWVAHFGVEKPKFSGPYGMWQYSWQGRVAGIGGDVDMDYSYKDYPAIIRAAGLNGFAVSGTPDAPEPEQPDQPDYPGLLQKYQALQAEHEASLQKFDAIRLLLK